MEKTEKKEKEAVATPDFPIKDMREGAKGVITWAEITNGEVARPSLEILTPARHLADQLGDDTKISTILIGKGVAHLADTLFEHDIELSRLLESDYDLYHFTESVRDGRLTFDYKLKAGVTSERNAIKILEICHYPDDIIRDAYDIVDQLEYK